MSIKKKIKKLFWIVPLPTSLRLKILNKKKQSVNESVEDINIELEDINTDYCLEYTKQILLASTDNQDKYVEFKEHENKGQRALLIAYYLTQYHPTIENNLWWGKGTTEWTNVTKAVPQYVGHYQPRLAGELGYYDLRVVDNIQEQIKIAKNYSIGAFAFYYYWFNGKRVLERPLNEFLTDKSLNMPFCLCWANENWTKRFTSDNSEVTLYLDNKPEIYKSFIKDIITELSDERYLRVHNKLVLIVYRPSQVPNSKEVLEYWRKFVMDSIGEELYIIASHEKSNSIDWTKLGFDDMSQFQPASLNDQANIITDKKKILLKKFKGIIYDYNSIIDNKIMLPQNNKMFPAVMPMWDNTPRRQHMATIYDNSSPKMYGKWLNEAISFVEKTRDKEERLVFLNAWNEWGEGAYLEPDRRFGYAYLEETQIVNQTRIDEGSSS